MMVAPFDRLFLDADVLLAVGTQLSDLDWWALDEPFAPIGRIIRVDLDAAVLDANSPAAVGLVGDAAAVLEALTAGLPATSAGPDESVALVLAFGDEPCEIELVLPGGPWSVLLDTHPDTRGRDDVALPYVTELFTTRKL